MSAQNGARDFRRFLVQSYVDELLDFLLTPRRYRVELGAVQRSTSQSHSSLAARMDGACRAIALKDELIRRFIAVGSEREIHLSESMRRQLLDADERYQSLYAQSANSPSEAQYDFVQHDLPALSELFDAAEAEVVRLLEQGRYVQLFYRQQTRNIDSRERTLRTRQAIVLALLSLALTVALLLTEEVRWYRLCAIPPLLLATTSLLTAQCGVCPFLELQGTRSPASAADGQKASWWLVASGQCNGDVCQVRDAEVRRKLAVAVKAIGLRSLLLTAALSFLCVGVPSHVL